MESWISVLSVIWTHSSRSIFFKVVAVPGQGCEAHICQLGAPGDFQYSEPRAVLSQGVQDGICNVAAARGTQRLQLVASSAYCNETIICYL